MEAPDTSPLTIRFARSDQPEERVIVQDEVQRRLDAARAAYRRAHQRGYSLSERGHDEMAQRILDLANAALRRAEEEYAKARGRQ